MLEAAAGVPLVTTKVGGIPEIFGPDSAELVPPGDPAALARDVAYARDVGYGMRSLRAFDAFPMTHHVECIAILEPVA